MVKGGSESLTGGTKDVNPQWMYLPCSNELNANGDGISTTIFQTPVNRVSGSSTKATIMEVLKIRYRLAMPTVTNILSPRQVNILQVFPGRQSLNSFLDGESGILDQVVKMNGSHSANDVKFEDMVVIHDLTDGAGHGVLVATDQISVLNVIIGYDDDANVTVLGSVDILYRFKSVGITEYIGLVQSQQLVINI